MQTRGLVISAFLHRLRRSVAYWHSCHQVGGTVKGVVDVCDLVKAQYVAAGGVKIGRRRGQSLLRRIQLVDCLVTRGRDHFLSFYEVKLLVSVQGLHSFDKLLDRGA